LQTGPPAGQAGFLDFCGFFLDPPLTDYFYLLFSFPPAKTFAFVYLFPAVFPFIFLPARSACLPAGQRQVGKLRVAAPNFVQQKASA